MVASESAFLDTIDLRLLMQALPTVLVSDMELTRAQFFNFPAVQVALINCFNEDQALSF
jgi:hypothetical protein